jgi:hypothetical protein
MDASETRPRQSPAGRGASRSWDDTDMADGLRPWQRVYRFLWRFYGPAQTGLPPYATEEEREAYRLRNQPKPPAVREPPPGYRFLVYTDPNGVPRRALIPIEPAAPAEPPGPAAAIDRTGATDAPDGGTTR